MYFTVEIIGRSIKEIFILRSWLRTALKRERDGSLFVATAQESRLCDKAVKLPGFATRKQEDILLRPLSLDLRLESRSFASWKQELCDSKQEEGIAQIKLRRCLQTVGNSREVICHVIVV